MNMQAHMGGRTLKRQGAEQPLVVIVGAGLAGIGAAIMLARAGYIHITLLERSDRIGGVWNHNTYPGASADVPAHLYEFSFSLNPRWARRYASQREIQAYIEDVAKTHGVLELVRLGIEVTGARWSDDSQQWTLQTNAGPVVGDVLIAACGQLSIPRIPDLPGMASFAGETFHTARWRHNVDLAGRRVALVGTGPSAIQVAPAIQPIVRQLDIYQRSPGWTLPKMDFTYSRRSRWWYEHAPLLQRLDRTMTFAIMEVGAVGMTRLSWLLTPLRAVAQRRINKAIADRDLRRKVTPEDAMGCKRLLLTDDWYSTLTATNVELITDPLAEVKRDRVVTANRCERVTDVLILATGFKTHEFVAPMDITGAGGQTLASVWAEVPRAYLGITVPGFPNMFLLHGPNTNGGTGSAIYMIEAMARHIVLALDAMVARSARSIEISSHAAVQFERELRGALDRTVWNTGCTNWYVDDAGNNASQWPWLSTEYRRRTGRVADETYVFDAQPGDGAALYSVS